MILFSCKSVKKITPEVSDYSSTIAFESDDVIVLTSKDLILSLALKSLPQDPHYGNSKAAIEELRRMDFEKFTLPLELKKEGKGSITDVEYYVVLFPALHDLLKSGQIKFFNKKEGSFEDYYYLREVKDDLGNETDVFYLKNSEIFLSIPVRLGE